MGFEDNRTHIAKCAQEVGFPAGIGPIKHGASDCARQAWQSGRNGVGAGEMLVGRGNKRQDRFLAERGEGAKNGTLAGMAASKFLPFLREIANDN